MKLFGATREQTPVEIATAALEQCAAKRDRLDVQLADAGRELVEYKDAAAAAALSENVSLAVDLADDVANIVARHEALEHAVGIATAELHQAEATLAREQDLELRAASVRELQGLIDRIEVAALPLRDALADLLAPLERGAEVSHDVKSIYGFLELVRSDIGGMLENAVSALGIQARSIELGSVPARLPKPAPTPVAISAPPPMTTSVFPLFDIRWADHAGTIRYAARGFDAPLPIATAQRALVAGIVVPADSPQAIQGRKERGSPNADIERAVDLDQASPRPPPPPAERLINPSKAGLAAPRRYPAVLVQGTAMTVSNVSARSITSGDVANAAADESGPPLRSCGRYSGGQGSHAFAFLRCRPSIFRRFSVDRSNTLQAVSGLSETQRATRIGRRCTLASTAISFRESVPHPSVGVQILAGRSLRKRPTRAARYLDSRVMGRADIYVLTSERKSEPVAGPSRSPAAGRIKVLRAAAPAPTWRYDDRGPSNHPRAKRVARERFYRQSESVRSPVSL
jgi:hypothetical protein